MEPIEDRKELSFDFLGLHIQIEGGVAWREWGIGISLMFGGPFAHQVFGARFHLLPMWVDVSIFKV